MITMLIGLAAVVVSAPMVAAIVVAVASRREDRNWSLGRPASSRTDALARRIVAFDADSIDWPRSKAQVQAEAAIRAYRLEAMDSAGPADRWGAASVRRAS
jgi:hypothetical protein